MNTLGYFTLAVFFLAFVAAALNFILFAELMREPEGSESEDLRTWAFALGCIFLAVDCLSVAIGLTLGGWG